LSERFAQRRLPLDAAPGEEPNQPSDDAARSGLKQRSTAPQYGSSEPCCLPARVVHLKEAGPRGANGALRDCSY
jgi:hypothetical protein